MEEIKECLADKGCGGSEFMGCDSDDKCKQVRNCVMSNGGVVGMCCGSKCKDDAKDSPEKQGSKMATCTLDCRKEGQKKKEEEEKKKDEEKKDEKKEDKEKEEKKEEETARRYEFEEPEEEVKR